MIYPREHTALLIRHQVCLRLPAFLLPIFIFNIFLSYLILFNFTLLYIYMLIGTAPVANITKTSKVNIKRKPGFSLVNPRVKR